MNFKKILLHILILLSFQFGIQLELISEGFSKPIHLCSPSNIENELYIVEQRGKILKLDSKKNRTTFLDIRNKVKNPTFPGDERGLLGMAFHPNYKNNGYFFINYIDNDDNTIISKFQYNSKTSKFNETILMQFKQPYSNHNGGHLAFGKDGYLYIAVGDGGSSGDPHDNAQNLSTLFGKILRIDVNNNSYIIPPDNPFINNPNARAEIWAYGLRNPWKFSFDFISNSIFIADVGQNSWEELNLQNMNLSGINYGWNIMEGKHSYNNIDSYNLKLTNPILEYPSNANYGKTLTGFKQSIDAVGCSITGGYVYRGEEIDEIKGHYFFADYCSGKIWSIHNFYASNYEITDWTNNLLDKKSKQLYISSFGQDSEKNLYIIDHNGSIFKITKDTKL